MIALRTRLLGFEFNIVLAVYYLEIVWKVPFIMNQLSSPSLILSFILLAGVSLAGCTSPGSSLNSTPTPIVSPASPTPNSPTAALTEAAARELATHPNSACREVGTIGATEIYNPNSQTWWFTLTPLQPKTGCKPACVISAQGQSEVNWRCTGLQPAK